MPRPGRTMEKSKDFKGSIKRLFRNLKDWHVLMSIAIILAMASAIFSLIAPNKLSGLTDTITDGLVPNTKVLKDISKKIQKNFTQEKMMEKIPEILASDKLTVDEKKALQQAIQTGDANIINKLDKKVVILMMDDIEVNNKKITASDQYEFIKIMKDTTNVKETKQMLKKLDQLPSSIYNLVKPSIDMNKVRQVALFLATLYLLSAIFNYIQQYSMTTVSNNFAKRLRSKISKKINRLPLKYFDSHETGDVLSRVTNDVDSIAQNMNQSLASLVTSVTLFIGSIIMMFITNWIMAITAIVSSLIGFLFMGIILSKSQKYFSKRQEELGNLNGYIEEIYSAHNIVKSYNGTDTANRDFDKLNESLFECNRKSQFLSGMMQPVMAFVGNFGYVAVCVVGGLLTMNNVISFGVIVAFMIYVRLFTNPLTQIAQATTSLQSTAAASERVFEFLDEKEMTSEKSINKTLNKEKVEGNIEFKNVKFGYDKDRTIINNFSAKAKKGEKIAIVGPTGAGKTTMVNLLMKFYEINDGEILIDGVSTKDLTRENIHDLFIMVLQDTWLFEGSVRENIKFNKDDVSDEEIWNCLKVVGIDHFVKTLPNGLDAIIKDNEAVSAGEKQLLTIARGMIKNAPFLILDEATSNVDTRTEELVQKAMDKLMEGRTSFIIAHRLSTIKNADLILVMDQGNIIEQGTHDELMKQKGFYEKLYNSQFEKTA